MNRFNVYILVVFSFALTFLVVYLHFNDNLREEELLVQAPLKVEAYRIDRNVLPDGDVYLNQRFLGKTDGKGVFSTTVELYMGESYTLRVEKDRDGYVYGPWETHFRVEREKKPKREKKEPSVDSGEILEGDFDILTEIERAQLGKASIYQKYHFLAILEGSMYCTLNVTGSGSSPVEDADIIVNGRNEGKTDRGGLFKFHYTGDDTRTAEVEVYRTGEHIWMSTVEISPNAVIDIELNKMLHIELNTYREAYEVIGGIPGSKVYLNTRYMGETDEEGSVSFAYINEQGVDGYIDLRIEFPEGYYPPVQTATHQITPDLPKLVVPFFAFPSRAQPPRIAVIPFERKDNDDPLLHKWAKDLKTRIEDYLAQGDVFAVVPGVPVNRLMHRFGVSLEKGKTSWEHIPVLKREVDGIIFGELQNFGYGIKVRLYGVDYSGGLIGEIEGTYLLRQFQFLPEEFARRFRYNFPFEGTITGIDRRMVVNLGWRHGLKKESKLYSYIDYFDEIKNDFARKRIARLTIVEADTFSSECEIESIAEGFLLEAGGRVKKYKETVDELLEMAVTVEVASGNKPLPDVNIYLDDFWGGQTDEEGVIRFFMQENTFFDLLVYKEGYIPQKIGITVKKDTGVISVDLKRGKTNFTIDSRPSGALLFINGEYRGTTPLMDKPIELPFGFHLVELKLSGYRDYREYMKLDERKVNLTGDDAVLLYRDYYGEAEKRYDRGDVSGALSVLGLVEPGHPDYTRSTEFMGYINLNDIRNFRLALEYYAMSIENRDDEKSALVSYYNMGQAAFNEAESLYFVESEEAEDFYITAVKSFDFVLEWKSRLPQQNRKTIYQNTLFYHAVSLQKLYYLTGKKEYIVQARYSWVDYFDFFDNNLFEDAYFQKQYEVASTYREEAERLQSED